MDFYSPRCLLLAGVILLLQRGAVQSQVVFTGSTLDIYDDSPTGFTVGTLASSGGVGAHSYALVAASTDFEITSTNILSVKSGASLDAGTTATYTIEIEASDSTPTTALSATGTFTVSVLANTAPTFAVNPHSFSLGDVTAGSLVGAVSASDPSLASYAIAASGNSFSTFAIANTNNLGIITVDTGKEANLTTYVLTVYAVDAGPLTGTTIVSIGFPSGGAAANFIGFLTIIGAIMLHVVKFI